jgi:hypothetical protein
MILLLLACRVNVDVGGDCRFVEVTEVLAANLTDPDDLVGDADYFEIHNRGPDPVNLRGYRFHGNQSQQPDYRVEEDCWLDGDAFQVFRALPYDDGADDRCGASPAPNTHFDFNNDGSVLFVWGPSGAACESETVQIPDQHYDFVWQRDPEDPEVWCQAPSSPGEPNPPCFCDVSDAC